MSESNISVNFRKENKNIYLESLNDGGKEIEVNKEIPILNISDDGKYDKDEKFEDNMNKILNKDTDINVEPIVETETDQSVTSDNEIEKLKNEIPVESQSGIGNSFIKNDEELVKKIEEIVTKNSINKNLNAEHLLTIKTQIPQLITDVENNIKNIGNTETTETALTLYSPDLITEYKNGIVDNIEQNFEKILVNKQLLDEFDKNTITNIAQKIYDEISKKFVHNELVKYNGDTTSDTTQNIEMPTACSQKYETEEFIKKRDCNDKELLKLMTKYHPDKPENKECINESQAAFQAVSNKRETCKNETQINQPEIDSEVKTILNSNEVVNENNSNELDILNEERKELFSDINKYKDNTEQAIKNLVALGEEHNKKALAAFNNNDIASMEQHIEYMKGLPSDLKNVESKIKGGKKNKTKKATKAGKKKTKRVRFVMTKKGRKNKKNRTRR